MNITKTKYLTYASVLIAGIILGWLIFGGSSTSQNGQEEHNHEQVTNESGEEVWTCSMHPSVRQDGPGSCPICGMDLIPVSSEERVDDYSMVMTEASIQLADIQTTPVVRERPVREIHLPGRVEIDERRISYVTAHFEGRIRDVKIDFTGAPIRKGEVMATIYSPELVSAQRELLQAVQVRDRNPQLYDAAVRKFRLWEFSDEQIRAIIDRGEVQTNMEILSPVDGFVMKRNVVDEQHVVEGTVIYEVANLDQIWITLDAYEEDLPWISEGNEITFQTRSNPGLNYQASIDFIDPTFNPQKRTIRVRANVENGSHTLRPDMLVRGTVQAEIREEKMLVPASAVLWTGPRSLVYVKDPSAQIPRFEVREVELGSRAGDRYIIESGIDEGDEVVFNGNFRIDSEFQLADRFSMMNREPGTGANRAGHDHGEMEMSDRGDTTHQKEDSTQPVSGQTVGHSYDEHMQQLVDHYLETKNALTNDDFETATRAFTEFFEEVVSSRELIQQDAHSERHEAHHTAMLEAVYRAEESDDIESFRLAFRDLSEQLLAAIENQGFEGVLYKQYCPMYEGGSNWISDSNEIENPFYGSQMHNCGETVEEI